MSPGTRFVAAAVVLGCSCAAASAETISFYQGPHRVELQVALDELDLVLAPGVVAEDMGARAPGAQDRHLTGRFESLAGRRVRYRCAPCADMRAMGLRACQLCRQSERIEKARLVCYRSARDLAAHDPSQRVVLTSRFVALLHRDDDPTLLAEQRGATVLKRLPIGDRLYLFEADSGLDALRTANDLHETRRVVGAQPIFEHSMSLRLIPDDPLFGDQWHLRNTGQGGGTPGVDLSVESAWDTYRGAGVEIAIVDDGLEITHPDLAPNHDDTLAYDFNYDDTDPSPTCYQSHGTAVAGVAAARGLNALGVSGAAPEATLVGIRLLAGFVDDALIGQALSHRNDVIDIYNNSWGPSDNGSTLQGPGVAASLALQDGVSNGRAGEGCIYVWAAGNGLANGDNTNYDGFANSRYSIAVTGTDNMGTQPTYPEPGACILVNAPSSGGTLDVTTTDLSGSCGRSADDYRDDFGKTSGAAPQAAGVIALILEANPTLSWRDVQHILVNTTVMNDPVDPGWSVNGAGRPFNHNYGFGRIDAYAAVQAALVWTNVDQEVSAEASLSPGLVVPDDDPAGVSSNIVVTADLNVETVEVPVNITTTRRGDLRIELQSPDGTVSILADVHGDAASDYDWTFTTVQHWDELSVGTWTLRVMDLQAGNVATLNSWTLRIWGTRACPDLAGDFDFDCAVDLSDFTVFAGCFAGAEVTMPPGGCSTEQFDIADADGDGDVDLVDFITFAGNFTG